MSTTYYCEGCTAEAKDGGIVKNGLPCGSEHVHKWCPKPEAGPALPALIGKKFTVALKPVPPNSPVLQAYVDIGNRLKTSRSSEMVNIEAGVTDFVHAVNQYPAAYPAMFAFLSGSSGLGKTQLAFALKRKVLYIPQSDSQPVYKCFDGLRVALNRAVTEDMHALRAGDAKYNFSRGGKEFTTNYINIAVQNGGPIRLYTVSLLLKMLELFVSSPADASYNTNVFLGADLAVPLEGMTLYAGWAAAKKYRHVLIFIDELPMRDRCAEEPFNQYLLLRNIIRVLGLPCLLSGAEPSLLTVYYIGWGSRRESRNPWARLLTQLPATSLSGGLTNLTGRCRGYEERMLQNTRPLLVQWFDACHDQQLTGVDTAGRVCMTPATLTEMKHRMVQAKLSLSDENTKQKEDLVHSWLHASTLFVFADSLQADTVTSSVPTGSPARVGAKRPASALEQSDAWEKQQIVIDGDQHTVLLHKHFALLHIPPSLAIHNYMTELYENYVEGVCGSDNKFFEAKAVFQKCTEDPLLYLAGLRGGLVCRDLTSQLGFVSVPSSYAFATFRQNDDEGNRLARPINGTALEAECIAALVLAAHRYDSFAGTPFFHWLARVVAELNFLPDSKVTDITDIPEELHAALKDVMVPLLSPPNVQWGDSMDSGINFGNLSWRTNTATERYGDKVDSVGLFPFVEGAHGYTTLSAAFKGVDTFGDKNIAAITTKVAANNISLLIGSNLGDWKEEAVQTFAPDVSVYRMNERGVIVRVSPPIAVMDWQAGRRILIAMDLKGLHPGRIEALPHVEIDRGDG